MNNKIEKLSYEELIKALDCCAHTIETNMCGECPAAKYKAGTCDDLVKLQAAEMLQAFKTENEKLKDTTFGCDLSITQIKSEAIQEFADRLKAELTTGMGAMRMSTIGIIDNLVQESVGDDK